jgi:hypothetical protein
VVEVGVADEHEIGPFDLLDSQADRVQARQPVEVAVEEQVKPGLADPEGRGPEPQAGVAGVAQDGEEALQEAELREVVEVALDASRSSRGGRDVGLAADPGDEGLRGGLVAIEGGLPVRAQRGGERRGGPGDVREPALHERVDGVG